jgi:ABC-type transporter Mla MlaB component
VVSHDCKVQTSDAQSRPPSSSLTFVVRGPVRRVDLRGLCDRFRESLGDHEAFLVECDVGSLAGSDLETVDALARFQLIGQQARIQIRIRGASAELRELLELVGLNDVVELCS